MSVFCRLVWLVLFGPDDETEEERRNNDEDDDGALFV